MLSMTSYRCCLMHVKTMFRCRKYKLNFSRQKIILLPRGRSTSYMITKIQIFRWMNKTPFSWQNVKHKKSIVWCLLCYIWNGMPGYKNTQERPDINAQNNNNSRSFFTYEGFLCVCVRECVYSISNQENTFKIKEFNVKE